MESRWQDLIDQLRIDVSESEGNLRDICREILEEFGFTDVSTQRATGGQFDPYIAVPDNFPCYYDLVGRHGENRMELRQNNISSKNKLDEYLEACSDARDRMEAPRLERARRAELQQRRRQRSPPRGGAAGRPPDRAAAPRRSPARPANRGRSPPPVATPNRNPAPRTTAPRRGPVVRASVVDIRTRCVTGPL